MLGRAKRQSERQAPATPPHLRHFQVDVARAPDETLAHRDPESRRIFVAAMAGEFTCSFCSHPGPHDDIGQGQGSEIAFSCARCGKHLDEAALKRSVFRLQARSSSNLSG